MKSVKMLVAFVSILLLLSCKKEEEDLRILPGKWRMVGVASSEGKIFATKPLTRPSNNIKSSVASSRTWLAYNLRGKLTRVTGSPTNATPVSQ